MWSVHLPSLLPALARLVRDAQHVGQAERLESVAAARVRARLLTILTKSVNVTLLLAQCVKHSLSFATELPRGLTTCSGPRTAASGPRVLAGAVWSSSPVADLVEAVHWFVSALGTSHVPAP